MCSSDLEERKTLQSQLDAALEARRPAPTTIAAAPPPPPATLPPTTAPEPPPTTTLAAAAPTLPPASPPGARVPASRIESKPAATTPPPAVTEAAAAVSVPKAPVATTEPPSGPVVKTGLNVAWLIFGIAAVGLVGAVAWTVLRRPATAPDAGAPSRASEPRTPSSHVNPDRKSVV